MCHYVQSLLLPRQLISTIFVQHFPFHEFNACCQEDLLPIVENFEFQYDGVEVKHFTKKRINKTTDDS